MRVVVQRLGRFGAAALVAVAGLTFGTAVSPVAAQYCPNDGCVKFMMVERCADGFDGTFCDIVGPDCQCRDCETGESCGDIDLPIIW